MNSSVLISIAALVTAAAARATEGDPASQQLMNFKNSTNGHIELLRTSGGSPVEKMDTEIWETPGLLENQFFMDSINRHVHETIPERVVHTKGAGAFGFFNVTHDVTDICEAKFLQNIGKLTRVFLRFSPSFASKGDSDLVRESRGFAVKFYTEDGNFDIPGFNTPMLGLKDPIKFPLGNHAAKRNPVTNLKDAGTLWDFLSNEPGFIPFFLYLFGDNGIPDGYRYMPGHSIHTYQLYNKSGISSFARFIFKPTLGIKNLLSTEAKTLSCSDLDYAVRDLYNEIKKGNYPSWDVTLQVFSYEDLKKSKYDPFDVTKEMRNGDYQLRHVGKLVLNENPTNYFAQVEQAAFCPSSLVRGILDPPDLIFKSRAFAYKASQHHRLGVNFENIEVNRPLYKVHNYDRDGAPPVGNNGGSAPNYYPNSQNGPEPYVAKNKPKRIKINHYDDSHNFEQATERYLNLSEDEEQRLLENIAESLILASESVQERMISIFKSVHPSLALGILTELAKVSKK